MKEFVLKVLPLETGVRLDLYLLRFAKMHNLSLSRNFIQKLIREKYISFGESSLNAHYKVKAGQVIKMQIPDKPDSAIIPEEIPLDIHFEDDDVLVINKPCGIVVHPGAGNRRGTLVSALLFHCKSLSSIDPERPGIVHRLDKDTSGLIVIAKNNSSHHHLVHQFAEHSVSRQYVALVKGRMAFNEGVIELPIGRHPRHREKMSVNFISKHRYAKTRYRVLKRSLAISLVELTPFTGRTHQLRVHLSFIGHPILGDKKYGRDTEFSRLALHACRLGFIHPRTDKFIEFKTPIPEAFRRAV
ncbi:MAG: RluA family pseudouridine synthase [Candidatus Omnitrophota bacterium]